jgi:hypothetical protein
MSGGDSNYDPELFKINYTDALTSDPQRVQSVFMPACTMHPAPPGGAAQYVFIKRFLKSDTVKEVVSQSQPIERSPMNNLVRSMKPSWGYDEVEINLTITRNYGPGNIDMDVVNDLKAKIQRYKDVKFLEAFYGNIEEGNLYFSTTNQIPFSTSNTVAVNYGSSDPIGMSAMKLYRSKELLGRNEVGAHEEIFVAVTTQQLNQILMSPDFKNMNYYRDQSKLSGFGTPISYMGWTFLPYEDLPTYMDGATKIVKCPYWVKRGMAACEWVPLDVQIKDLTEVAGRAKGLYVESLLGFGRTNEVFCGEILCKVEG